MTARGALALLRLTLVIGWAAAAPLALAQDQAPGGEPARVVGAPRGPALSGAALDARTEEIAGLLRCPVCQGLSVADSPATMAVNMRAQVRELVALGYDREQILAYFEHSYGEFVRLEPPLRGVNWLVWLGPILALAAGAFFVARALGARRGAAAAETAPLPGPATLPDDPELARYVRRVRELAYGWPDGRPREETPDARRGGPVGAGDRRPGGRSRDRAARGVVAAAARGRFRAVRGRGSAARAAGSRRPRRGARGAAARARGRGGEAHARAARARALCARARGRAGAAVEGRDRVAARRVRAEGRGGGRAGRRGARVRLGSGDERRDGVPGVPRLAVGRAAPRGRQPDGRPGRHVARPSARSLGQLAGRGSRRCSRRRPHDGAAPAAHQQSRRPRRPRRAGSPPAEPARPDGGLERDAVRARAPARAPASARLPVARAARDGPGRHGGRDAEAGDRGRSRAHRSPGEPGVRLREPGTRQGRRRRGRRGGAALAGGRRAAAPGARAARRVAREAGRLPRERERARGRAASRGRRRVAAGCDGLGSSSGSGFGARARRRLRAEESSAGSKPTRPSRRAWRPAA